MSDDIGWDKKMSIVLSKGILIDSASKETKSTTRVVDVLKSTMCVRANAMVLDFVLSSS